MTYDPLKHKIYFDHYGGFSDYRFFALSKDRDLYERYQQGHEDGYAQAIEEHEHDYEKGYEEGYHQAIEDYGIE